MKSITNYINESGDGLFKKFKNDYAHYWGNALDDLNEYKEQLWDRYKIHVSIWTEGDYQYPSDEYYEELFYDLGIKTARAANPFIWIECTDAPQYFEAMEREFHDFKNVEKPDNDILDIRDIQSPQEIMEIKRKLSKAINSVK